MKIFKSYGCVEAVIVLGHTYGSGGRAYFRICISPTSDSGRVIKEFSGGGEDLLDAMKRSIACCDKAVEGAKAESPEESVLENLPEGWKVLA